MKKYSDIKKMKNEELQEEVKNLKKEFFELKLSIAAGEAKDYSQFKKIRKNIARSLTLLKQKENIVEKS